MQQVLAAISRAICRAQTVHTVYIVLLRSAKGNSEALRGGAAVYMTHAVTQFHRCWPTRASTALTSYIREDAQRRAYMHELCMLIKLCM